MTPRARRRYREPGLPPLLAKLLQPGTLKILWRHGWQKPHRHAQRSRLLRTGSPPLWMGRDPQELRCSTATAQHCHPKEVFTLLKVYGLRPSQIAQALVLSESEVERCLIAPARATQWRGGRIVTGTSR